jgi:antitoxin HicB
MNDKPEFEHYPFTIEPGSAEDGGGFFVSFPDLPGCVADGETYEEAIGNARDAFAAWMIANQEEGGAVPLPGQSNHPVKYVQRLPQSLHKRVTRAAELDGVSMNTLVSILIAEGLGRREGQQQAAVPHRDFTLGIAHVGFPGQGMLPVQTAVSSPYFIKSADEMTGWPQGSLAARPVARLASSRRRQ